MPHIETTAAADARAAALVAPSDPARVVTLEDAQRVTVTEVSSMADRAIEAFKLSEEEAYRAVHEVYRARTYNVLSRAREAYAADPTPYADARVTGARLLLEALELMSWPGDLEALD